jgi:hypothetical protein
MIEKIDVDISIKNAELPAEEAMQAEKDFDELADYLRSDSWHIPCEEGALFLPRLSQG